MTLKVHVIIHHYAYYFKIMGKNVKDTNGEFTETLHSTLKKHEVRKGFTVKKKLGTHTHLVKAIQSITSFNSIGIGFTPSKDMTLRRKRSSSSSSSSSDNSSPASSPRKKQWTIKKSLNEQYPLYNLTE